MLLFYFRSNEEEEEEEEEKKKRNDEIGNKYYRDHFLFQTNEEINEVS